MSEDKPEEQPWLDPVQPRLKRSAAILQQDRTAGPMPWVIAIMIALTVIAVAGGLALGNAAGDARAGLAGGLTVQIVEGVAEDREQQAEAALALLQSMDSTVEIRRVPDAELAELLEPWLGEAADTDMAIPTPALIDVRLFGAVTPDRVEAIRAALEEVAPAARVDAQSDWLAPVFDAIAALQWLAAGLVALLAAASVAAVWLAVRNALVTNRETISLIHHLGATDPQIARQFQRTVGMDAALGGVAGLALGLVATFVLGRQFAGLGSGMAAGAALGPLDWLALAAVPVVALLLAVLTARFTVLASLRRRT